MKRVFSSLILALGLLAVPAQAADYPTKPITLMTAFNAGGGSDVSHRLLEKFAKGIIPQPIVVTYKAGAGGEIGWTWLAGAKPDGYTIGGVDLPHEGEEFGFVLSGEIELTLGKSVYKVSEGSSFYFRSDKSHCVTNKGSVSAKLLWISCPPNF